MRRCLLLLPVLLALTACDQPQTPAEPAAEPEPVVAGLVEQDDQQEAATSSPETPASEGEVSPAILAALQELEQQGETTDIVEKVDLPTHDADGTPIINFEQLASYRYPRFLDEGEEPPTEDDIPDPIKALDGKTVVVSGYMMPTKLRNGRVEKFMLVPNTLACCFGKPLELNEWVNVEMSGKPADPVPDVRIAVRGVLRVGENKIDGWVMDLYRMEADRVRIQEGF